MRSWRIIRWIRRWFERDRNPSEATVPVVSAPESLGTVERPPTEMPPPPLKRVSPSTVIGGPLDGRRAGIRNWIANYSLALAELYEASVRLMHEVALSGRVILVCHAVREIRNRLPEMVSGTKGAGRLDYTNRVEKIVRLWRAVGLGDPSLARSLPTASASGPARIETDRWLLVSVAKLLADHGAVRERPEETAARLFLGAALGDPARREELRPVIVQWLDVTGWFTKHVHVGLKADADHDLDELRKRFELFEMTLAALAQSFYETVDDIDAILEEANR